MSELGMSEARQRRERWLPLARAVDGSGIRGCLAGRRLADDQFRQTSRKDRAASRGGQGFRNNPCAFAGESAVPFSRGLLLEKDFAAIRPARAVGIGDDGAAAGGSTGGASSGSGGRG